MIETQLAAASGPGSEVEQAGPQHTGATSPDRGVTFRVAVLSILLAAFFGYCNPIVDFKVRNTLLGGTHLPIGAVGVLLMFLLVINPLVRLVCRRMAFSRNETLTVYITCLFSTLVPGRGGESFWITNVLASFYLANQENGWFEFMQPYIKPWVSPAITANGQLNTDVVNNFYMGGVPIPWGAWLVPIIAWAIIVLSVYTMLACLGVILRAQWAEHEALSFPLLKFPLEMTEDMDGTNKRGIFDSFIRTPAMWTGFGLALFLQSFNGLNNYFADFPRLAMQLSTAGMFSEAPWKHLGPTTFLFYPVAFGLSYLLTTEVAFSLWFFYWFAKFQIIIAYYMGLQPEAMPMLTWTRGWARGFTAFQQIGAYIAYLGIIMWVGREHYLYVIRRAFGRAAARENESKEALSYPVAFWGFIVAFAIVLTWTVAAGVRIELALALWFTYLTIALILTRVVVEGGLLFVQSGWSALGPIAYLTGSGPGTWLTQSSLVPAAMIQGVFMTDMRAFLLPSFLQSFKLAYDRGINTRRMLALIAVCIVVAMSVGWWNILRLGYNDVGGLQLDHWWFKGNGATQPSQNALELSKPSAEVIGWNWVWMGAGGLMTWAMMWARSVYLWFPLHPIGLIMSWPPAMYYLWFSIFLGWLCKVLVIKYSGNEAYRRLMPFFLGVALGDVAAMLFWLLVDGWTGQGGHILLPT